MLEANAQLIARRFPDVAFSILTPDGGAHWDGTELRFSAGLDRDAVRDDVALRSWWHLHHAGLLRNARVGTAIPEADDLDEAPRAPDRPPIGPVVLPMLADTGLQEAVHEAADCRRCHLHDAATQTVFGEGPAHARVLFMGEQPGDQEDIIGRPFVGPAGQIMDRAMEDAGIDRRTVYITNAVKHFKFTPRGKRRIHQTPEAPEVQACQVLAGCGARAAAAGNWWSRWAAPRRVHCWGGRLLSVGNAAGRSNCRMVRRGLSRFIRLFCCACRMRQVAFAVTQTASRMPSMATNEPGRFATALAISSIMASSWPGSWWNSTSCSTPAASARLAPFCQVECPPTDA